LFVAREFSAQAAIGVRVLCFKLGFRLEPALVLGHGVGALASEGV
jgi:hypothetical protein